MYNIQVAFQNEFFYLLPAIEMVFLAGNFVLYIDIIWVAATTPGNQFIAIVMIPYAFGTSSFNSSSAP